MSITTSASVEWKGEHRLEVRNKKGGMSPIDGDAKTAISPVEAMLGGMASCSAIDIVEILEKRKTPVKSLKVDVVGVRVDSHPRRLTKVTLKFIISGDGIDQESANRAAELSVTKYCSVRASIDPAIEVNWSVELNPAG
jgi:putative redox protein